MKLGVRSGYHGPPVRFGIGFTFQIKPCDNYKLFP